MTSPTTELETYKTNYPNQFVVVNKRARRLAVVHFVRGEVKIHTDRAEWSKELINDLAKYGQGYMGKNHWKIIKEVGKII